MNTNEVLKLALGALEYASTGNRRPEVIGPAITALREALANEALDRMAENARELGLDYTGNGTAGREADVKPTGFFFQMPDQPAGE